MTGGRAGVGVSAARLGNLDFCGLAGFVTKKLGMSDRMIPYYFLKFKNCTLTFWCVATSG